MPDEASAGGGLQESCGNCGTVLLGPHCHACGMRHAARRLRMHDLAAEAWRDVFGLDGRLRRTVKELTLRPGDAIRTWVGGRRDLLVAPFRYYFAGVVAYMLAASVFGLPGADRSMLAHMAAEDAIILAAYLDFAEDHLKTISVVLIPLLALLLHSAFRSRGQDLAETFAFTLLTSGHCLLLTTPVVALCGLVHDPMAEQAILFGVIVAYGGYTAWAAIRFFGDRPGRTVVKVFACFAAFGALYSLLLTGLLIIAVAMS